MSGRSAAGGGSNSFAILATTGIGLVNCLVTGAALLFTDRVGTTGLTPINAITETKGRGLEEIEADMKVRGPEVSPRPVAKSECS